MKIKIHIGSLIKKKMEEDGRKTGWLAKQIHCKESNIYKIYEKSSINSELLLHISQALQMDFFEYYSNLVQKN